MRPCRQCIEEAAAIARRWAQSYDGDADLKEDYGQEADAAFQRQGALLMHHLARQFRLMAARLAPHPRTAGAEVERGAAVAFLRQGAHAGACACAACQALRNAAQFIEAGTHYESIEWDDNDVCLVKTG